MTYKIIEKDTESTYNTYNTTEVAEVKNVGVYVRTTTRNYGTGSVSVHNEWTPGLKLEGEELVRI